MVNMNNNNVKCRVLVMRNNGILRIPTTELKFLQLGLSKLLMKDRTHQTDGGKRMRSSCILVKHLFQLQGFFQEFFCAKLG